MKGLIGIGIWTILFLILLVLKLTGNFTLSWWIFLPAWILAILILTLKLLNLWWQY
jgi:hypothetical protein